jgi:hypothetical protein
MLGCRNPESSDTACQGVMVHGDTVHRHTVERRLIALRENRLAQYATARRRAVDGLTAESR